MSRTKSQPCHLIKDRGTCLTSTDSRNMIYAGEQLFGSNCNWCPDGPCTSNNANRCEPEPFLKTKGVNGYETCIKGKVKISTRVYSILLALNQQPQVNAEIIFVMFVFSPI